MEASNKIAPKVESLKVIFSLPMGTPTTIPDTLKFSKAETFFTSMRDTAGSFSARVDYDRARAFMKYCTCYSGKMTEMKQVRYNLKVTLNFMSLNDFLRFIKNMASDVTASTIY